MKFKKKLTFNKLLLRLKSILQSSNFKKHNSHKFKNKPIAQVQNKNVSFSKSSKKFKACNVSKRVQKSSELGEFP